MRSLFLLCTVLITLCLANSEDTKWQQTGLNDQSIKHLMFYGENNYFAGGNNGLHLFFNNRWYSYDSLNDISVTGLAFIGKGDLVVISGDGKETDGIYIGKAVINGPPFFQFKKKCNFSVPQALTVKGVNKDTLYIGSGNTIVYSAYNNEEQLLFDTLHLPAQCFGSKKPYCSAIKLFNYFLGVDIYAGGFDESGSEADLIRCFNNQIDSILPLSISTISYEYHPNNFGDIYFATRDSLLYNYGYMWSALTPAIFSQSPNNEMVFHIQTVSDQENHDTVFVTVESGVYYKYSLGNDSWHKIGQIPEIPYCLLIDTTANRRRIIAGTEKGVYVYDTVSTMVKYKNKRVHHNNIQINFRNNKELVICFPFITGIKCSVKMYNCKGIKLYDNYFYIRENKPVLCRLSNPVVKGVYYVQLVYGSDCEIIKLFSWYSN